MNLKNYTSTVNAITTISYIETYLADCGVTGISKEFKEGMPVALYFRTTEQGKIFTVRLPSHVPEVLEYLWADYLRSAKRPRKCKEDFKEQAMRVAWKIQQDWVQVQMSLVKLKQAAVMQVFMAFIWDGEKTFFEQLKSGGFKQIAQTCEVETP